MRRQRQEENSEEVARRLVEELKLCRVRSSKEYAKSPWVDKVALMADPGYDPSYEFASEYEPYPGLLEAGDKLIYLGKMLNALWFYWVIHPEARHISFSESETKGKEIGAWAADFEAALDLSLAKLALQIGIETSNIRYWKKKKEAAVRLNLSQKMKTNDNVIDAFNRIPKNKGDTFNLIVSRIYNYLIKNKKTRLNKNGQISPGKKTIGRSLEANKLLMANCFKRENRGQKERIFYIGHTGV
jgi:hypothetical protein